MGMPGICPAVVTDAGVENVNSEVDELIDHGILSRLIALTDIRFSNSLTSILPIP